MSDNVVGDDIDDLEDILRDYATEPLDYKKDTDELDESVSEEAEKAEQSGPSHQPKEWIKTDKEIQLEKLIFGDKEGLIENLKTANKNKLKRYTDGDDSNAKKRKPAWHDDDDEVIQLGEIKRENKRTGSLDHLQKDKPYKEYLKTQFARVVSNPKWANLDRVEEPDSDEEIIRTVGFIDSSKSLTLQAHTISYKKLKDLNRATYAEGPVSSVNFHPTSTVAMVSGLHGIATLYSVNGLKNEKLHSIRFKDYPIICAKILPCGTQALFGSRCKSYYSYDLMKAKEMRHVPPRFINKVSKFEISPCGKYFAAKGRYSDLHLFDMKTKELIKTFKQNEPVSAIKFSLDSGKIFSSSRQSTVTIFDIKQQRQMHKFFDDGCIVGKSLALSPDGRMLATGSGEGAVNIYDYGKVFTSNSPLPEKTILNLTTAITGLNFNHTSEMLAICSDVVPSALKLVHFPSGTVFANFPGNQSNLKCIRTMDFSPSSGFLALGNSGNEAPLYRLKHFSNY